MHFGLLRKAPLAGRQDFVENPIWDVFPGRSKHADHIGDPHAEVEGALSPRPLHLGDRVDRLPEQHIGPGSGPRAGASADISKCGLRCSLHGVRRGWQQVSDCPDRAVPRREGLYAVGDDAS